MESKFTAIRSSIHAPNPLRIVRIIDRFQSSDFVRPHNGFPFANLPTMIWRNPDGNSCVDWGIGMPLAFRVESPFVYNFFFSWLIYLSSPSHRRFGIHSHNNTNGDTWTEETGRLLYSEGFCRLRNPDICLFWLISEAWDDLFSSSGNTKLLMLESG